MSDTLAVQVGNKGRVVVPAGLRARHGWREGTALVAVDTELGVLLADRASVEQLVQAQLRGVDLLGELLSERRAEAASESL